MSSGQLTARCKWSPHREMTPLKGFPVSRGVIPGPPGPVMDRTSYGVTVLAYCTRDIDFYKIMWCIWRCEVPRTTTHDTCTMYMSLIPKTSRAVWVCLHITCNELLSVQRTPQLWGIDICTYVTVHVTSFSQHKILDGIRTFWSTDLHLTQ